MFKLVLVYGFDLQKQTGNLSFLSDNLICTVNYDISGGIVLAVNHFHKNICCKIFAPCFIIGAMRALLVAYGKNKKMNKININTIFDGFYKDTALGGILKIQNEKFTQKLLKKSKFIKYRPTHHCPEAEASPVGPAARSTGGDSGNCQKLILN